VADIHQLFDGMIGHENLPANDRIKIPLRPENYSDEALATRFTTQHQDDLKFVNIWGKWLVWDGMRWRTDDTLMVTDHARALVREASNEILEGNGSRKLAAMVSSAKTVSAIERLARADRHHASQTTDWDSDPWMLNTPNGTVDLKTGQLLPQDRRTSSPK
jgi:putative DNA primase/helicase